jgi:hypothetical protein
MEVLLWYALAAAAAVFAFSLLAARYAGRAATARRDRSGYTVFAIFALMLSVFSMVLAWMSGH